MAQSKLRRFAVPVATSLLSAGLALADSRGFLDFIPNALVGVMIVAPLVILIWWVYTHESAQKRRQLVQKHPIVSLIGFIVVGGSIGILLGVILWWTASKPQIKTQDETPKTSSTPYQPRTLHDYFFADFNTPNYPLIVSETYTATTKNGRTVPIEINLYPDFEAKSEVIAVYILDTDLTYKLCEVLARGGIQARLLVLQKKEVAIEEQNPGQRGKELKDLHFSGRVFIYHETPLFQSEKDALVPLFKENDLDPVFRDVGYVSDQNRLIATKQEHEKTTTSSSTPPPLPQPSNSVSPLVRETSRQETRVPASTKRPASNERESSRINQTMTNSPGGTQGGHDVNIGQRPSPAATEKDSKP